MPSCAGSYLGKVEPEAVHLLLDCSAADNINQLQGVSSLAEGSSVEKVPK